MEASPSTWQRIRRRGLLWLIAGLVAVVVILSALSGFYIDVLWFREVGFSGVFWTVFWTRVLLALVFGLVFFVILYANLLIARAIRPRYQVFSPGEEAVDRYRVAIEPYAKWILPGLAALFAVFAAAGVAGQWEAFQQWRASGDVSFGVADPVFDRDISFYVLSLPFLEFVQGWLLSSLIVITLVTAGAHYLWGGIRFRAVGERVTAQVKAHLSVLLGIIVLVKAWGYRLGQFDLLISPRGTVTGASYTDVNAQLPALRLLVVIAVVVTVLFLVNIRFRGWALPAIALGLLALTSIVAGAVFPAAVQRFSVDPQELQREREFIDRNIEFSRRAYGLDRIEMQSFPAEPDVSVEELEENEDTIDDIRLWSPSPEVLGRTFLQLQRIRPYYEFIDVDVDRYEVDGERRLVMVAPREVTQDGIPGGGQTWQNRHLFYTHGFGGAGVRANSVLGEGVPDFILGDIPPEGDLAGDLEQPRVYFQETSQVPFVVVRTDLEELDFPMGEQQFARTTYDGEGGIEVGGLVRRLALAWQYRDVNLLISGLIDSESKVLINMDLPTRVRKVAPFLKYDGDPYMAIVDGRVVWIWDAYTTTDRYPYSEIINLSEVSTLTGQANYIRNSVKVAVDAYNGTMTFYVVDEEDPIIQAWQRVFPDLFTPGSEAPRSLQEHYRYPEDLFRVQANQFANYHVTQSGQFYAKEDFWSVPQVPVRPTEEESELVPLEPYYVLMPLPGEEEQGERFVLFTPFTPADRPQMVAWMAAVSDPEDYGRIVTFEFPLERNVPGPENVAAFISQDTDIAQQVSLWDQLGSRVIHGDLLAIPIGRGFLWVQPLYLRSATESAIPELKRVILVSGENVTMATDLQKAIAVAFDLEEEEEPEEPEEPAEPGEPGEPEPVPPAVRDLLAEAERHFTRAQAALQAGDLATYQREIEAAQQAVADAVEILARGGAEN